MPGVGYPGQFAPGVEYLLGAQNVTVCHHVLSVGGAKVTRPAPNGDVLFEPPAVVAPTVVLVQDEQPVVLKRRLAYRPIDGDVFAPAPQISFGGIEVQQPKRQQIRKSFIEQPYTITPPAAFAPITFGWFTAEVPPLKPRKTLRPVDEQLPFQPAAPAVPITFGWQTDDVPTLRKRKTLRPIEEPLPFLPPAVVVVQPLLAWDAELPQTLKRPRYKPVDAELIFAPPSVAPTPAPAQVCITGQYVTELSFTGQYVNALDLTGQYAAELAFTGQYVVAIDFTGQYITSIEISGVYPKC